MTSAEVKAILDYRLSELAGFQVSVPLSDTAGDDVTAIIKRGRVFDAKGAIPMPGTPSQCHSNVARMYEVNSERVQIATGFAVTANGHVGEHSWAVARTEIKLRRGRKWLAIPAGTVLETTLPRVLYYGIVLSDKAAEEFCYWNES